MLAVVVIAAACHKISSIVATEQNTYRNAVVMFQRLIAYVFYPVTYMMGFEAQDCLQAARLLGNKILTTTTVGSFHIPLSCMLAFLGSRFSPNGPLGMTAAGIAQLVVCPIEKPGATPTQVRIPCAAIAVSHSQLPAQTATVCNRRHQHLYSRKQFQTLAPVPYF